MLGKQTCGIGGQSIRDFSNDGDRWISHAAFNTADVGSMEAAFEGQLFLRPALFKA